MHNVCNRIPDIIDMESYECGYATGCVEGESAGYDAGYHACKLDHRRRAKRERENRLYALKWRVIGFMFILLTMFMIHVLDGDATIALFNIPLGLAMIVYSNEEVRE